MKKRMKNKKGFTLAELLIVVAIIAVLVATSIPIFTAQLESAREATDAANLRAAYAELSAELLTWDGTYPIDAIAVPAKQLEEGWSGTIAEIGGIDIEDIPDRVNGQYWLVYAVTEPDEEDEGDFEYEVRIGIASGSFEDGEDW